MTCTPNSDFVTFTFPVGKGAVQAIAINTLDYFSLPGMESTNGDCDFTNIRLTDQNTTTGVDSTELDYLMQGGWPVARPKNNNLHRVYDFYIELTNDYNEVIFSPPYQLSVGCT